MRSSQVSLTPRLSEMDRLPQSLDKQQEKRIKLSGFLENEDVFDHRVSQDLRPNMTGCLSTQRNSGASVDHL